MATQAVYVELDLKGNKIIDLGTPTVDTDAATKKYVDALAEGLQTSSHIAATGANAINVNDEGQVVSLVIDPAANGILSQSSTGLSIDLDAYATDDELSTAVSGLQDDINAIPEVVKGTGITLTPAGTGATANITVAVDETWLAEQIEEQSSNKLTAGVGIGITAGTGDNAGTDVVSAVKDPASTAGVLEITTAGIKVDVSAYAKADDVAATYATQEDLSAEAAARVQGDTDVFAAVNAEATNRQNADDLLAEDIAANADGLAQEIADRGAADTALSDRITPLETAAHVAATAADASVVVGDKASQTIGVQVSKKSGNILVLNNTDGELGLYVPTPGAVNIPVSEVTAKPGETTVTKNGTVFQVGIDGAYTDARDAAAQAKVDTAVTTLNAAIDLKADKTALAQEVTDRTNADTTLAGGIADNAADILELQDLSHKAATAGAGGGITVAPDQVISVDSTVARKDIDNAFTTVQSGQTPTLEAHLTTKGYVDKGVGDLGTELRAADSAITTRINNLSIVGDGLVTANRAGDTWTLSVDSLQLSNTLTGTVDPAVDAPTADAGDIYINTTDGGTFIFTGTAWVEMSRAADAVTTVNEHTDGSITVTNPAGPVVTVGVSEALRAEIAANTLANTNQQTEIDDLGGDIISLQAADAAQDTVIASKAVAGSAPVVIAGATGGTVSVAGIPALATVTVVDSDGCVATLKVCGATGTTGRDFTSNVAFTGTVYWTGL